MVLIFVVSSLEQPPLPMPEFEWLTIDKLYHFIEYAILGALLARALVKAKPSVVPARLVWHVAAVFSILYGASDEWHPDLCPRQVRHPCRLGRRRVGGNRRCVKCLSLLQKKVIINQQSALR